MNGESHVNTHWTERLSEYLDGELAPAERAACDAHLALCATCRFALEDMQGVIAMAKADPDVMPVNDLWMGIADRIGSAEAEPYNRRSQPRLWGRASARPKQISFTLPQLALAASLLIAVSSSVAYIAAGRAMTRPGGGPAEVPIQAQAEPMMAPSADIAPANFADAQFDRAVSDLERVLVEQRDELDPRTVVVIERNLAAIDEAIQQARAALSADPGNQFLNSHLAEARRRKLDLLRHAAALNSAGD
jgi:anti-sigma factor RsiW